LVGLAPQGVFTIARDEAINHARRLRAGQSGHRISFIFKKDVASRYSDSFLTLSCSYQMFLITETKDRLYVFHAEGPGEPNQLPYGTTYSIAKSDIVLTRIPIQNTGRADHIPTQ
jgi:hypothetical protein